MRSAKVSIWAAKFSTKEQMQEYLNTDYSDEGDLIASKFMRNFDIKDYDEDFLEAEFYGDQPKSPREMMDGFSYAEQFLEQIPNLKYDKNCIIALYEFNYQGDIKTDQNTAFIGVFDYKF